MRPIIAVICFMLATATAAAASDLVVIAADNGGKALSPGAVVKAGSKVSLPAGARVTLLAQSGEVISLKGPFSGPVKAGAAGGSKGTLATVSRLISKPDASKTVGATRMAATPSTGAAAAPGDVWVIEANRAGRACARSDALELWRPVSASEAKVGVWHKSGPPKRLVWPGDKERLKLAGDLVEADMQLSVITGKRSISIILSMLPPDIDAKANGRLLQWLADRGCTYQARKLIARLHAGAKTAQ